MQENCILNLKILNDDKMVMMRTFIGPNIKCDPNKTDLQKSTYFNDLALTPITKSYTLANQLKRLFGVSSRNVYL